jgi:hypothetical protein
MNGLQEASDMGKNVLALCGCMLLALIVAGACVADGLSTRMFGGAVKAVDVGTSTIVVRGVLPREDGAAEPHDMTFKVADSTQIEFWQRPDAKGLGDVKVNDIAHISYDPEKKIDGNSVAISIKIYPGPPVAGK